MRIIRLLPVVLVTALAACVINPKVASVQAPLRPNIILILADDMDAEYGAWIDYFPRFRSLLASEGTTFGNALVNVSICGPSRASILRGQYAHNSQIFTNEPPGGGFQRFYDLGLEKSTLATWLHDSGYKTVLLGKYINGYGTPGTPGWDYDKTGKRVGIEYYFGEPGIPGRKHVPPGWDEWYSGDQRTYNQFNYDLIENGEAVNYGNAPQDYLQDVIRRKATDFIRRVSSANPRQPFFMSMDVIAPHQPETFAPRHADAFPGVTAPRPPSFNEKETEASQHPRWLRRWPQLTETQIKALDEIYRNRLRSLLAVEETVEEVIQTLRDTGQLENTYIVFTSDNGFHLGQHRLPRNKNTGFKEDYHVPLIVRGPGVPAGRFLQNLVANVDLAPTFAELAGIRTPEFVDGRSLVPLLRESAAEDKDWRHAFLLEHGFPQGEKRGLPPRTPFEPTFYGLHTDRNLVYIEYPTTGEKVLYDLEKDPYQQTNIAGLADATLISKLSAWLSRLRSCIGNECRAIENELPVSANH